MTLLFATQNQHKRDEVQSILGDVLKIISLSDLHFKDELPETHFTLEENAFEKAQYVFDKFEMNCFSEDTGLEIESLGGAPGVFSARYGGEQKDPKENIRLVLKNMEHVINRAARFRTVVCLIWNKRPYFFEGLVQGKILTHEKGSSGFGYDPIFIPDGFQKSFAEMNALEKNNISHRSKAILAMKDFLMQTTNAT